LDCNQTLLLPLFDYRLFQLFDFSFPFSNSYTLLLYSMVLCHQTPGWSKLLMQLNWLYSNHTIAVGINHKTGINKTRLCFTASQDFFLAAHFVDARHTQSFEDQTLSGSFVYLNW